MKLVRTVVAQSNINAIDLLSQQLPELSKGRLKDAMAKGAVLLSGKPQKRLRRAQTALKAGQQLQLHYDADLLQRSCEPAILISDQQQYSVWFKPAGMLSQGNEWGDHMSLLRAVEQHYSSKRQVFLLHRLDREASGLVIIAHTKHTAAAFSKLIAARQISKTYLIKVKGQLPPSLLQQGELRFALDDKPCLTRFSLRLVDSEAQQSWLDVDLISGRKHQIRRHFALAGHPVMGDPQYGKDNKDLTGLALQAVSLAFVCPKTGKPVSYVLPNALWLQGANRP
ncbi:RluA family pseudouridine synthase [Rheinheimera baltica]|uniref:RluA family pseudouridine synthase n=1 Tax=Rheinheimera baltica TaxID=67576 RepID=A0ABT9I1B3_9GAMM|nr:RluA family pseudouridine synthase [Rheinheimera baltica]MDP5137182.1 RluA family pseudouridine synthase [Rheinheimera baltica]MDP5142533.1 RluA family pseudouridine synthase [Rheinheimera baltica]